MVTPKRIHAPLQCAHITARIQNGAPLLVSIAGQTADLIVESARISGMHVLALIIMPNHFHVIVRLGHLPLSWTMQRIMQRTAYMVRRHNGGEGHVFGRRYWARLCLTPGYVRRAIVYTHLNAWKKKLGDEVEYEWGSHRSYAGLPSRASFEARIESQMGKRFFADDTLDEDGSTANYLEHVAWAKFQFENTIPGERFVFDPVYRGSAPAAAAGDRYWRDVVADQGAPGCQVIERRDTCERAQELLHKFDRTLPLDAIRGSSIPRRLSRLRCSIVAALVAEGHRRSSVARALFISQGRVSQISSRLLS